MVGGWKVEPGEALLLKDSASGWAHVESVRVESEPDDRVVAEAALLALAIIVGPAYAALVIAQVVDYVKDHFHQPVVVDFTGDEPKVTVLHSAPGLSGKTFVKTKEGEHVEIAATATGVDLAKDLKTFLA